MSACAWPSMLPYLGLCSCSLAFLPCLCPASSSCPASASASALPCLTAAAGWLRGLPAPRHPQVRGQQAQQQQQRPPPLPCLRCRRSSSSSTCFTSRPPLPPPPLVVMLGLRQQGQRGRGLKTHQVGQAAGEWGVEGRRPDAISHLGLATTASSPRPPANNKTANSKAANNPLTKAANNHLTKVASKGHEQKPVTKPVRKGR